MQIALVDPVDRFSLRFDATCLVNIPFDRAYFVPLRFDPPLKIRLLASCLLGTRTHPDVDCGDLFLAFCHAATLSISERDIQEGISVLQDRLDA